VSRRQDVDVVDQGPSAELSTPVEERGDPGPLSHVGVVSTHDPLLVLVPVLGPARRGRDGRVGRCRRGLGRGLIGGLARRRLPGRGFGGRWLPGWGFGGRWLPGWGFGGRWPRRRMGGDRGQSGVSGRWGVGR
jgi:hypothetical protein